MKPDPRPRLSKPPVTAERTTGSLPRPAPAPPSPSTTLTPDGAAIDRTSEQPSYLKRLKLSPSEFNTAIVHFYRGEVQRSNTWRNRLDTTTNWAVLTAGATLSFAFSSPMNPHFVILINSILVAFFLFMEARRYRYYEIWSSRVRMIETGYFAKLLSPESPMEDKWAEDLTTDLITPHFTISEWEAVGRRLRRNYLWIFALLALSWNLKVYLHPLPAYNFEAFIERAGVGIVPGWAVIAVGFVFNAIVLIFAVSTVRLRQATGEVLPPQRDFSFNRSFRQVTDWTKAATIERGAVRRAKKARERARTRSGIHTTSVPNSGEWKRPDKQTIKEEPLL